MIVWFVKLIVILFHAFIVVVAAWDLRNLNIFKKLSCPFCESQKKILLN
jgi:hypothetical protein